MLYLAIFWFQLRDGQSPEILIRNADSALYQAKDLGRNNLQLFDSSMNQAVHQRIQVEQDLRKALKGEQLFLHYQPLIDLADGELVGLEAFVEGVPDDPDSVAIVRAVTALGKNLGMKVVAEGVETQNQLEMLRGIGCDVGQGFFLGRPAPAEDLRLDLETRRISLADRVPIR